MHGLWVGLMRLGRQHMAFAVGIAACCLWVGLPRLGRQHMAVAVGMEANGWIVGLLRWRRQAAARTLLPGWMPFGFWHTPTRNPRLTPPAGAQNPEHELSERMHSVHSQPFSPDHPSTHDDLYESAGGNAFQPASQANLVSVQPRGTSSSLLPRLPSQLPSHPVRVQMLVCGARARASMFSTAQPEHTYACACMHTCVRSFFCLCLCADLGVV